MSGQPLTAMAGPDPAALRRLVAILLGLVPPVLMIIANQSTQITVPIGFLAAAALVIAAQRTRPDPLAPWRPGAAAAPLALAGAAALAWMAASVAWSPRPAESALVMLQVALIVAVSWVGLRAVPACLAARHARWLIAGVAIGAVLALVEFWSGFLIRSAVGADPQPFRLNRMVVTIAVLLWPAALALVLAGRRLLAAALVVVVAAASLSSLSQSAVVAVGAGALALAAGVLVRPAALIVAAAAGVATAATPLLFGQFAESIARTLAAVLKPSAFHRVEIWHWFSLAVSDRWLTGYGLQSSRFFREIAAARGYPPAGLSALEQGHPHSLSLQVWVELGLVGVVLMIALTVMVAIRITRLPQPGRAFALATFVALLAVAFISHGAWQIWWLALIALAIAWLRVLIPHDRAP